jgi:membrane protein YqaA with SNARE-associated domain
VVKMAITTTTVNNTLRSMVNETMGYICLMFLMISKKNLNNEFKLGRQ